MALRARKVPGAFEKRAPGPISGCDLQILRLLLNILILLNSLVNVGIYMYVLQWKWLSLSFCIIRLSVLPSCQHVCMKG